VIALVVPSPALAKDFIQAAAFFWSGLPNVETKAVKGGRAGVDPAYTQGGLARVFLQSDDEPCTLIEINLSTGRILLIDFTKMPGPNDFGYDVRWHSPPLVDGAWCEATARRDDSAFGLSFTRTKCWKEASGPHGHAAQQLDALRFIREAYCMGRPQGPRPY
jgi:hypothetical protein